MSKITKFGREMLENKENIAVRSWQILYVFVLGAEVLTTFGSKVVIFSARS